MDQNNGETPNPLNPSRNTYTVSEPRPVVTEVKSQHKSFKKKSLFIGGIVAIVMALGCGVVATLLLLNHHEDPVSMAVQKLMEGGYSSNVAIDGTIELDIKDKNSDFTSMRIELDSTIAGGSVVNSTSAKIIANVKDSLKPVKFSIDEVYSNAGDLYFKIDDLREATVVDCQGKKECGTNESSSVLEAIDGMFETIGGEWIRISGNDAGELLDDMDGGDILNCATTLSDEISGNINSLAKAYKNNPFAFSSKEEIPIARKDSQVYRVMVDSERFMRFADSVQDLGVVDNLTSCTGYDGEALDIDSLRNFPPLYVEVNDQYQFTRLYFEYDDENVALTVDLGLDYPDRPVITEPVEYQDFDILMQGLDVYEEDTEVEAVSD